VSTVNLLKSNNNPYMNIFESFGWIIVGFLPTLCALDIAYKVGAVKKKYKKKKAVVEEEQEKKVSTIAP
jgi:hypothetical protein